MKSMGIRALGGMATVLAAAALLATGCSSNSSPGGTSPGATQSAGPVKAVPGTVLAASGSVGTYLTDHEGRALYLFVKAPGPLRPAPAPAPPTGRR